MRELCSGTAYNTHNITSLIRTLKYVSDILQTEEAFTVEEYKHTHAHAHTHTHTHTYTHTHQRNRYHNMSDEKKARAKTISKKLP